MFLTLKKKKLGTKQIGPKSLQTYSLHYFDILSKLFLFFEFNVLGVFLGF